MASKNRTLNRDIRNLPVVLNTAFFSLSDKKVYFVEEGLGLEKEEDEFLHTENFVLVDNNRYIRGIYNGLNKTAIQQLIVDINTLKKEKGSIKLVAY